MPDPLWTPSARRVAAANLTAFIDAVRREYSVGADFGSLYRWSVDCPEQFWPSVWSFCGVIASRRWDTVRTNTEQMLGTKWFHGAQLNFAENLLRYRDDQPALIFWNENGFQRLFSFAQLFKRVAQATRALRALDVRPGDRVAAFMPNLPETVVAMLGSASLGAIWSSTSPDFGLPGVLDRFGQIQPKVLFTADGYRYGGKCYHSLERVSGIVRQIPSIQQTIVVGYLDPEPTLADVPGGMRFEQFISLDTGPAAAGAEQIEFEQLPFDHPLYILYTSGTTGEPKCIVHSAGGTLLQHLKELVLHTDLKRSDRIFYFTTCGWMMWNWLLSSLATGATVILYDGSPFHPQANILFDMAERERITVFGTSARYLAAIEKAGLEPRRTHDLSSLRTILSTGSPLSGESFDYVYQKVKSDVCLSSISGGTDIVSCFALGNPLGPVFRGQLQTRGLGMKVLVYDDNGQPIQGRQGELVCAAPFPSMPTCFWNDPQGENYHRSYFEQFPGVWWHGDYVELTEEGGMIFYGRSDAVLNPGGVRIGTAEIYRQVEQLDEVLESIVVGQEWEDDVRVVLFVKLQGGATLDETLKERIRRQIRENTTPRHVPKKILQVDDIPRTLSGKIVELAVRDVIHGRAVKNKDALANPAALDLFKDLPELTC